MLSQCKIRRDTSRSTSNQDISSLTPSSPKIEILSRPQAQNAEQSAEPIMESIVMLKRPPKQAVVPSIESTFMLNALSTQTTTLSALISSQTNASIGALKPKASEDPTLQEEPASAVLLLGQATRCKTIYRTQSFSSQGLGSLPSGDMSLSELRTSMMKNAHAEKTSSTAQAARPSMPMPMEAAHLKIGKNEKSPSYSIIPTYDDTTDTLCWWSITMDGPRDAADQANLQQCSDAALEDASCASTNTAWWNVPPGLSVLNRALAKHKSSRPVSPAEHDSRRLSTIIEVDSPIGSGSNPDLSSHKLNLLSAFKSPRSSVSSTTTAAQSSSSVTSAKRPDSGYQNSNGDGFANVEGKGVAAAPSIQRPAKACVRDRRSPDRSSASSDTNESSTSMNSSSSSSRYVSAKHSPVASCNVVGGGEGELAEAGGVAL